MEETLEIENLQTRRTTDRSFTNRINETEERISDIQDSIEGISILVKENTKGWLERWIIS